MTNLLKKNSTYNFALIGLVLLMLVTYSQKGLAATLNGILKGGSITWLNAIHQSDYLVLSNWQPIGELTPTKEWVPASVFGNSASIDYLTNNTGVQVSVDLQVSGLEYGLGKSSGHFNQRGTPPNTLSSCQITQQADEYAFIIGANCFGKKSYLSTGNYTPFQFVRPVISINEEALIDSFRNTEAASGVYTGTVMIKAGYVFRSPTGTWTYRSAPSVPITLSIRYEASSLNSIKMTGTGIIQPDYDKKNHTVSGWTQYLIQANGYFTDGLKLTFVDNGDGRFQLEHKNDNINKSIPYSIDCFKCIDKEVVKNGGINVNEGITTLQGDGDSINFRLKVHYDNINVGSVETGAYQDSFIVYFEENL